ncbi:MAG: hypothetical protein LBL83_03725 [Clostridiales bacterium]|jgi:hypothetical protein|nr:hypothetical protein [Clostridiales bacterium]
MANDFFAAIAEIMPLARGGDSSLPFIIFRKAGGWPGAWLVNYPLPGGDLAGSLARIRARDPLAAAYTGADFAGCSPSQAGDTVLARRLRDEYRIAGCQSHDPGALCALSWFCANSIGEFPRAAKFYLTTIDRPLTWLFDEFVSPLGLTPGQLASLSPGGGAAGGPLKGDLLDAISERCDYEMHPDKALIERLRDNYAASGAGDAGLLSLMMFMEKNLGSLSEAAKEGLMSIREPLGWLGLHLRESGRELEKGIGAAGGIDGGGLLAETERIAGQARSSARETRTGGAAGGSMPPQAAKAKPGAQKAPPAKKAPGGKPSLLGRLGGAKAEATKQNAGRDAEPAPAPNAKRGGMEVE